MTPDPLEREDPEIGLVRYCKRCGEWWPKDAEFFYFRGDNGKPLGPCRACHWDKKRERKAA